MKATKPLFDLPYRHRPHMNGKTFVMNGKTYKILSGTWGFVKNELTDLIRFEEVMQPTERDEPVNVYRMPESEFFLKTKGLF